MKKPFELAPYKEIDVRSGIDLATYRSIMHFSMWIKIRRTIVPTRAFEAGIDTALMLLRFTEQNQEVLTPKELNDNRVHLYELVLDCLDRLDRWEEYLDVWDQLRKNTSLKTNAYAKEVVHNNPLAERSRPFILRETKQHCYFHFLRNSLRRKRMIEQKIDRKLAGKKCGNLTHRRREDLSAEEVGDRLRRMKEVFAWEDEWKRYWTNYWRSQWDEPSTGTESSERKPNHALLRTRALKELR